MDLEEQKKLVIPFLQRAQEIQKVDPRVAYYCRMYALEEIINIGSGAAEEIKGIAKALFMQLEKDKPSLIPLDPVKDKEHCINFALRIFRNADRADCAGQADLNTCKAYYAASIFLQITSQFNDKDPASGEKELDADLAQKARYAVWRAAEIRKALKEGRAPVPPNSDLFIPFEGTGGGTAGAGTAAAADRDPFAGPAYEQEDHGNFQDPGPSASSSRPMPDFPPPPNLPMGGGINSIGSAADDFLNLPAPPQTQLPPPASHQPPPTAVAAAAGPRYRQGSKVLALLPSGEIAAGTVGMALSPGPNTMYKVALRDHVAEVPDSCLAPMVSDGSQAGWVRERGAPAVTVTVLASNMDKWPPTYLIQVDRGMPLDTDCYHMLPALDHLAGPPPPVTVSGPASSSSPGISLPAAPPLRDEDGVHSYPQVHGSSPWGTQGAPSAPAPPPPGAPPYPSVSPTSPRPAAPAPKGSPRGAMGTGAGAGGAAAGQGPYRGPGGHDAGGSSGPVHGQTAGITASPVATSHAPSPAAVFPQAVPGFQPSLQAIQEAHKAAKYAVSSLAFDDVSGGVKFLTDALRLLTQPGGK